MPSAARDQDTEVTGRKFTTFCILLSSLGAPPVVKTAAMQSDAVVLHAMWSFRKQGQGGSGHSTGGLD